MVDDGRTTDGRTTEHGYTISSPCEPDGSGELIKVGFKGVYSAWACFPDGINVILMSDSALTHMLLFC